MKIDCWPSWESRHNAKKEWHRWFALVPVRIAENDCRWLEYVQRKGRVLESIDFGWIWEYRPYNMK